MPDERPSVVIAGGSGFLGEELIKELRLADYSVIVLSRSGRQIYRADKTIKWDGKTVGDWAKSIEGAAAVINLSGETINQVWSEDAKKRIMDSRVLSTRAIGQAIAECPLPPQVWLNASAVGYYGDRKDQVLTEISTGGTGFLPEICLAWEKEVDGASTPRTRKIKSRTGIVFGKGEGSFETLLKLTNLFLGGQAGSGRQFIPWIHAADVAKMWRWALERESISGAINVCSPNPARNSELMRALRKAARRPWSPPVPKFAIQMYGKVFGPDPELVFISTRAIPDVAREAGYPFAFPTLEGALADLVER